MKNILLIIALVLLIFSILINNSLLVISASDSDQASIGIIILLASIFVSILGIQKFSTPWSKRKRVLIKTFLVISIVMMYLISSALVIYYRSQIPNNEIMPSNEMSNEDLSKERDEFISELNKTLSTVSEQSNGFYSVLASYNSNDFILTYKINIENDISISDDPIDALVNEAIKTYKSNGTIELLRTLEFKSLTMTFSGKSKTNFRIVNLSEI
jgi:hypothetical protein